MQDPDREGLKQEALRWLSRLTSGEATDTDRELVLRWRKESGAHEQAFQDALRLWKALGDATVARPAAVSVTSRRRFMLTGVAAAAAGGIAVAGHELGFWPGLNGLFADYTTAAGERRELNVADNVKIELNTRSALSLTRDAPAQNVVLSDGEAAFTVRPGSGRFIVAAGDVAMSAERGVFVVRHDSDNVRVICLENEVEILRPEPLRVRQFEQVACTGQSVGMIARVESADAVAGWRRGLLVFRNEPFAAVIDEFNRYRPGLIVVVSRTAGERRVTGTFHLDRLDEALQHIQQTLNVPVRQLSPYFTVIG